MANTSNKKSNAGTGAKQAQKKQPAKQSASKKSASEPKKTINRQMLAVILAGLGILFGFMVFVEGESGWTVCHDFLGRIFGYCSYLLPVIVLYIAIICSKDKSEETLAGKIICAVCLHFFACIVFHILGKGNTAEYLQNTELSEQIAAVWHSGNNGGVIGAVFGGLVCKLIGKTGATIISVILLVVFVLLVTGMTLPLIFSYIKKPVKKIGKVTNERFEENARRREEEKLQREKAEEERKNRKPPEPPTKGSEVLSKKMRESLVPKDPVTPVTVPGSVLPVTPAVNEENKTSENKAEEKPVKKPLRKAPPAAPKEEKKQSENEFIPPEDENKPKGDYEFPPIDCLNVYDNTGVGNTQEELTAGAQKLIDTLQSFKINASITNICRGPSVTRYELVPEAGVRISKITTLSDDLALRLAAASIRMEAPIPGKSAIGIEVPNSTKSMVSMRELVDTDRYRAASLKSKLSVALGKDITGNIILADLAKMPHLLVAGTTGSGKSVCLNSMIISILYNAKPDEVKLLMIDPKQVEFTVYNGIGHLAVPVVSNPRKAAGALAWAVSEMEKRYAAFAENGVRDIKGFNKVAENKDGLVKMHHIVIFIDELSDLMMASPKEVEDSICRLAQMARAAGIHLVIATQRPSVDVITGVIKANIPSRIALSVSSQIDSRTILDQSGAEKLLGNGDMLFNPVGMSKPIRVQGCFISDEEVEAVINHIKSQYQAAYDPNIMQEIETKAAQSDGGKKQADEDEGGDLDPMFNQAAEVVILAGQASTTMLQKKLKLGYARASRVMDELEENGIVGPSEGAKPRQVLLTSREWYEMQALAEGGANTQNKNEQIEFGTLDSYSEEEKSEDIEINFIPEEEYDEYDEEDEFAEYDEYEEYEEEEPEEEPQEVEDIFEEDMVQEMPEEVYEEYEEDNPLDVDYIFADDLDDETDEDLDSYFN